MIFEFAERSDAEVRSYMNELANQGRYEVSDSVRARFQEKFCRRFL